GELLRLYSEGGEDPAKIFESHKRQAQARRDLTDLIPPEQIVSRDDITSELLSSAGLVIAFGGDNHFQHVSHFINDDTPILGINSDPLTSHGALLQGSASEIAQVVRAFSQGEYLLEPWTRLTLTVDGIPYPQATADIFFGEEKRVLMSRYTLEHLRRNGDGELVPLMPQVEQKCSGLLVATGAGSSGWFRTAARGTKEYAEVFAPCAVQARYAATEISPTITSEHPEMFFGELHHGDVLRLVSLNRSNGIASIDSLITAPFARGQVAELRLSQKPLLVARSK
ncbi:MAG: hypothetical protein KDD55_13695, partial [Bdellovibrionales bacterium]|nr:hypothetical protein [Bdellovibrionales bacterium]